MRKLAELLIVAILIIAIAVPVFAEANRHTKIVPMNSWEYSALVQLASAKGCTEQLAGKPITRSNAAGIIASALPLDLAKASRLEVETLERLTEEFKEELGHIGIIVNALDDIVHQIY